MKIEFEIPTTSFYELSTQKELTLFLIKKELQGTKLTMELDRIGFDHSLYTPELGDVILSLMGFNERGDHVWDWYFKILNAHAEQVDLREPATAREQALGMYLELGRR